MKIFIFSFLGSFFGIITAFICLNFFKRFRNLIFSDKALDYKALDYKVFKNFLEKEMPNHRCHKFKMTPGTKIETYKIELDKIIDRFIKNSRDLPIIATIVHPTVKTNSSGFKTNGINIKQRIKIKIHLLFFIFTNFHKKY